MLLLLFVRCGNKPQTAVIGNDMLSDTVRFSCSDTFYINQALEIDNLKLNHSTVVDFETFKNCKAIQFQVSTSGGQIDPADGYPPVDYSFTTFQNDSPGLKFDFSTEWTNHTLRSPELLSDVLLSSEFAKVKFYNGVTFQSAEEEVIRAFGKPAKEDHEYFNIDNQRIKSSWLNYTFDDGIIVLFGFRNNLMCIISMRYYNPK
jgi:hypothetical protein